jgi:hypothetical protein
MLDFLSEHLDVSKEVICRRACLDAEEVEDVSVFEVLGIPLPQ